MTPDEQVLASLIADALSGTMRLNLVDIPRLAAAARVVRPERLAPLALTLWLARDPHARALIDRLATKHASEKSR